MQYLTILMTEKGGAITFCRVLASPMPPLHRRHNLKYLNDREGGGGIIFCRIAPPPASPDSTILNDLNDRERGGAPISCKKINI